MAFGLTLGAGRTAGKDGAVRAPLVTLAALRGLAARIVPPVVVLAGFLLLCLAVVGWIFRTGWRLKN